VQESIYNIMLGAQRAEAHRIFAEHLERIHSVNVHLESDYYIKLGKVFFDIVHHYSLSNHTSKKIKYLQIASAVCRLTHQHEQVYRYCSTLVTLTTGSHSVEEVIDNCLKRNRIRSNALWSSGGGSGRLPFRQENRNGHNHHNDMNGKSDAVTETSNYPRGRVAYQDPIHVACFPRITFHWAPPFFKLVSDYSQQPVDVTDQDDIDNLMMSSFYDRWVHLSDFAHKVKILDKQKLDIDTDVTSQVVSCWTADMGLAQFK